MSSDVKDNSSVINDSIADEITRDEEGLVKLDLNLHLSVFARGKKKGKELESDKDNKTKLVEEGKNLGKAAILSKISSFGGD